MTFSTQLEARLAELVKRYPPGHLRGALVPMLLYIQDEVGLVSEQVVTEVASRLQLTTLQVEEVVGYYSMLRRKPAGRHHVQVCTNISCLLRGGEALWEHARKKLGLQHKETSADGAFSLEEVECIGGCSWAPAVQVGYDYYHEMTLEKFDELVEKLKNQ